MHTIYDLTVNHLVLGILQMPFDPIRLPARPDLAWFWPGPNHIWTLQYNATVLVPDSNGPERYAHHFLCSIFISLDFRLVFNFISIVEKKKFVQDMCQNFDGLFWWSVGIECGKERGLVAVRVEWNSIIGRWLVARVVCKPQIEKDMLRAGLWNDDVLG